MTEVWVIVIVCALGALACFMMRKSRPQVSVRRVSYRCVGIEASDPVMACSAVTALAGHRFLSGQSPPLPVPGCTARRCSCRFVHFEDRRSGSRRKDRGQPVHKLKALDWAERRNGRGRRKGDRAAPLNEAQVQAALAEKRRRADKRSPALGKAR